MEDMLVLFVPRDLATPPFERTRVPCDFTLSLISPALSLLQSGSSDKSIKSPTQQN